VRIVVGGLLAAAAGLTALTVVYYRWTDPRRRLAEDAAP
jgi:hypothetical protein